MVSPAETADALSAHGIPDARFEAQCMIQQLTGQRPEQAPPLTPEQTARLRELVQRRIAGEPLQYLLGEWEFYGMRLFVGEGVLIPRPDTETLVDAVLTWCREDPSPRIIDLCTGSGCIALALKQHLPGAEVRGMDVSETALRYARRNAGYHQLDVNFLCADVTGDIPEGIPPADVIVSNPPYLNAEEMASLQREVRREPALALAGGADGLQFYRSITARWKSMLRPGGLLAYETGETQAAAVSAILRENGFTHINIQQDLARNDRVVLGCRA